MFINTLQLQDFRNYQEQTFTQLGQLNVIYGSNGVGKTNLLEAVGLLATLQSPRTNNLKELVRWNRPFLKIRANIENFSGIHDIIFSISDNGEKAATINQNKQSRHTEVRNFVHVVFFTPEDIYLVKGTPELRRKYLNSEISQISPTYASDLHNFGKVLYQRNKLLKEIKFQKSKLTQLDVWDYQLADFGSRLILKRLQFLQKLRPLSRLIHRKITGREDSFDIGYSGLPDKIIKEMELQQIKDYLQEQLYKVKNLELERGITLVGPQRNDMRLTINGVDARLYASQGQQRTIALALRLGELELMKGETGEYPILLLDDVFSELDYRRRELLLETVFNPVQTFLTTTDLISLPNVKSKMLKFQISLTEGGPECTFT